RIGAHAAGIGAGVALAHALVVLRGTEGKCRPAVAKAEEARLLAFQKLLDHDLGTGPGKAGGNRGFRLRNAFCDRYALACGQPVCLDDDRRTPAADIGNRFFRIVEALVVGRRNGKAGAQVLGETLGALEPCRCGRWPEDTDTLCRERIGNAGYQRRLRSDNDEIDIVGTAEGGDGGVVGHIERDALGLLRDPRVARRGKEPREHRRGRELPRQCVLTSAGADEENVHATSLCQCRGGCGIATRPAGQGYPARLWTEYEWQTAGQGGPGRLLVVCFALLVASRGEDQPRCAGRRQCIVLTPTGVPAICCFMDVIQSQQVRGRVADAPSGHWVYRALPRGVWPYAQLARWDRPIGWQLLLWPCWWSAALAAAAGAVPGTPFAAALPSPWHLVLFLVGAITMRGAGCTYNDLVDQDIDEQVERTRSR